MVQYNRDAVVCKILPASVLVYSIEREIASDVRHPTPTSNLSEEVRCWTEAGTPANKHFFRFDVSAGTPSGSFTINTTRIGGAAYTATLVAQTTVQCS
jgi:hypothetical protein